MQTLSQTLQDYDRGQLKIIAHLWELELPNDPHAATVEGLSSAMLSRTPEILETLPGGAKRALELLLERGGRVSIEALIRQFGPLREMGPAKRDRLEPWNEPASPLEMLWYRGLMARAFADSEGGPQEYGFVPDDLLDKFPEVSSPPHRPLGAPAPSPNPNQVIRSGNFSVDDATTLLAAHRRTGELDREWLLGFIRQPEALDLMESILREAGVIGSPENIGHFLQSPRHGALALLQETWRSSSEWNELSQIPGLISPVGDWPNDPREGRRAALALIDTLPSNTWWSLSSFVDSVYEQDPGFMRPPGGFESWYLQSGEDGSSLRGFEAWHEVEGQFLRHLITAPMLWLEIVELSHDQAAFRMIETAHPTEQSAPSKASKAVAWPDGRIRVGRGADRTLRYQLSRFCSWERMDGGAYYYRLTARSLKEAEAQGLTATHAHKVLSEIPAPEGVLKAVERRGRRGIEVSMERQTILQVSDPEILKMLADDRTARRYLAEQLSPISVIVEARHWPKLQEAALRLGLLIDVPEEWVRPG